MKKILLVLIGLLLSTTALPKESNWKAFKLPTSEFNCLVTALYYEANLEPAEGILAVAKVVLNRKDSKRYPKTVCGVIKHQMVKGVWQFSFWGDKKALSRPIDRRVWKQMERIAQQAVNIHYSGFDIIEKSMYYYNPDLANPGWAKSKKLQFVAKIGKHRFYKRVKN